MKFKLLFPLLMVVVISCESEVEINHQNVTGAWHASGFEAEVDHLSTQDREEGEKDFLSSIYTLHEDQSLEIHSDYFSNDIKGQWELDVKTNEISMLYNDDSLPVEERYSITYLSKNKLKLRKKVDVNEYKGFVEITFVKK